ncbi:MAG: radical SAM protein [Eubacteriales bacterium]
MWFQSVCVVLTKKCNADCDICCQSCSNATNEKIDIDKTLETIKELRRKEAIRMVGITGGEPFIYFSYLIRLVESLKELGIGTTFTTNGFWGNNYETAYEKLNSIKKLGIKFFTLSVDDFHEKFVPYQSIANIIDISKKLDIRIIINSVSTKNSKRLKGVLDKLEDSLINCNLIEIPCVPVGHAAERIKEEEYIYMEGLPTGCCEFMNIFTILPNGDVYPCCSEAGMSPVLYLGNIHRNSVDDLLKEFYENCICRVLREKGTTYIYNEILSNEERKALRKRFISSCDMCHVLFENKELCKKIERRVRNAMI